MNGLYYKYTLKKPSNLKVICNENYNNKHPSFLMFAMGTNMTESKNSL
jgi:hypothetical protein